MILLTPLAFATECAWSFSLRGTCAGVAYATNLCDQLTPPYARCFPYAQVDITCTRRFRTQFWRTRNSEISTRFRAEAFLWPRLVAIAQVSARADRYNLCKQCMDPHKSCQSREPPIEASEASGYSASNLISSSCAVAAQAGKKPTSHSSSRRCIICDMATHNGRKLRMGARS